MAPRFVVDVPEVEIIDGIVHTRMGDCEWYWRKTTFIRFIGDAARCIREHQAQACEVIPLHGVDAPH